MKSVLQRRLALTVAISVMPWLQAEVCPMKLYSQQTHGCGATALKARHVMQKTAQVEHDCCPTAQAHKAVQAHCTQAKVSACGSPMTCCSLDPQPVTSPEKMNMPRADVILALLDASAAISSVHGASLEDYQPLPPEDAVFRLKEDLRI